jgi:hypothetical protein
LSRFGKRIRVGLGPSAFETFGEIVVGEVPAKLPMSIVVALHGGLLEGPVHPFDLPVGPLVRRCSMPYRLQARSKGWPRNLAVAPDLFLGRSAN